MLKNDSFNTLAKACLFVRINEWKQIEFQHEAEKKREEALKERGFPTEGFQRIGNESKIQWLKSRIEQLEKRLTWIERLLMTEGRGLFSVTATHISH
jgi:hypothetical protein